MTDRLKPGDILFYQQYRAEEWSPSPATIDKVGRKWATLVNGHSDTRVNIETLALDGRYAYGRLWRSEAEWRAAREAERRMREDDAAYAELRKAVGGRWNRPKGLDAATIREAMRVLGMGEPT